MELKAEVKRRQWLNFRKNAKCSLKKGNSNRRNYLEKVGDYK